MSNVRSILLRDARAQLTSDLARLKGSGSLEEAFTTWLLHGTGCRLDLDLSSSAIAACSKTGGARSAKDVAILGYAAATGLQTAGLRASLGSGLTWLSGRKAFGPGMVPSFELNALALLGIALGAIAADAKESISSWMVQFLPVSASARIEPFELVLLAASAWLLGRLDVITFPAAAEVSYVRIALRSKGIGPRDPLNEEHEVNTMLTSIRAGTELGQGDAKSACWLASLDWATHLEPNIDLRHVDVRQVVQVLKGISFALKRWTWEPAPRTGRSSAAAAKWVIDHEYHVQNLAWMVLAPIFPDLEDEENLPSVGHKHPRCDLCIPSLRLIIEVKYVRAPGDFAKVIDQIGSDASLYLTPNSNYDGMIALVWDNTRRSEQHDELTRGLGKIDGIIDTVVISRPGMMDP